MPVKDFIDAAALRRMFLAGVSSLEAKKAWINELNVFPVPDGDTGTNMSLTLMSAVKEIRALGENASMSDICSKMSMGTLRGARGNSGVITSQLCRGFAKVAGSEKKLDRSQIAEAMSHAVAQAYKAVMKPKEGTILTVAKAAAVKANELSKEDISMEEFFRGILAFAEETLEKTPDMLPVLKEAGVVDSGGQGLVEFFKGIIDGYLGKEASFDEAGAPAAAPSAPRRVDSTNLETSDIKFGYCTEFIIMAEKEFTDDDEDELKKFLESIGDSLVVVAMDGIVKVHVHTNHPGQAFEKGLTYGQLTSMKVDNMREEHNEKVILEADRARAEEHEAEKKHDAGPKKAVGFVAVAAGAGLVDIYKELNVDKVVEGGQTMNPSTEDILAAITSVNADTVFVFPNNSNIVMTANQAAELCEGRKAVIIPSKTVLQGITALISYDEKASVEENTEIMTEALGTVKSAEITYAVRDTELYGKTIRTGDYMGIGESRILAVGTSLEETAIEAICDLADEDTAMITIYYGADVSEEDAQKVADAVEERNSDAEVELVYGGQPVYYYFASVE